jgi:hypothetical protein
MGKISETNIVEAVIKTNNALSKGKHENIETAWNELDNILKEDLSHVHSKIIDTAVDVFQAAGLTLCELKELKRK